MRFLTLGSFVFFTGLVGFLTWRITRKHRHDTSDGYFLAGRALTGGLIAGSLLLTNLSTEQLVGLNGAAFQDGLCVMAWEVIAALALVTMGLYFLPRYLRSGITTLPQFLQSRFDDTTRVITSLIFIVAYVGILLPIILYTGATGLATILDVRQLTGIQSDVTVLWVTVWLIGSVGSLYAIFGGLRTVAVSDTLNGCGLLVGGVAIAWFGLQAVDPAGPLQALSVLRESHPEKFNSLGGPEQSVPFATLFTGVLLLNLFYWCTNQQIIQRTFGARTLAEGQKGVLLAGGLKVMAPLILVLPGMIAFHLYAAKNIENDHAYGTLVRDVLPGWMTGFFAAVMVGAILSSFNSALNSTATLFSLGVYKQLFRPAADDQQVIRVGKRFAWIVALASMTVAPMLAGQESIFKYLQKMNGLYAVPIFAVVVVGMLTRRVPALAAKLGLVLGFVTVACGYFLPFCAAWLAKSGVHDYHFQGWAFGGVVLFMLVVRWIAPTKHAWRHEHSGDVDLTPWKGALPLGLGLALFVLLVYLALADFSVVQVSAWEIALPIGVALTLLVLLTVDRIGKQA